MEKKLKIGVLGAGHLGKIHIKCIKMIPEYELVGFYDPIKENAQKVSEEFNIKYFDSIDDLIQDVDVVDVVTPTLSHFECASLSLKKFKHVFIEKPITHTLEEAKHLLKLAHEAKMKVQVGHVERFNPAFQAAIPFIDSPMFIETHRLAEFNPRGTDVPVVHDLMIHDIDIILSVVKSRVKRINASGVAIVSDTPDIANARIEFENGCVANVTASRISMKNMRKTRFFQKDAYVSVDFLKKKSEIIQMNDIVGEPDPFAIVMDLGEGKPKKEIRINNPDIKEANAIKDELEAFANSILNDTTPVVTIDDGFHALEVVNIINNKIKPANKVNA